MNNVDSISHIKGETLYIDDIPVREGTLYGVPFLSPVTHGKIKSLDYSEALKMKGVVRVITTEDIQGENQIGNIIQDEILLPEGEVHFRSMPMAILIAETEALARKAVKKITADIEELPPIIDAREAHKKGNFLVPTRTFNIGDSDAIWEECAHVFEGTGTIGGQEHVYLETQGSYAFPLESGNMKVHSGTQGVGAVHKQVAKVLGLPMSRVEIDTLRLGGAFGGKEDQATVWSCMAALSSYVLKKPVKIILSRADDMVVTGKRHPYDFDYKIGLDKDLKILGYEVEHFQNGGAAADVSPAVMERTLFHGTGSYYVPNTRITVHSCKTNLPPNTAYRGFGAPQATFAIETAIARAADSLKVNKEKIQRANLLVDGNQFPFGQIAKRCKATKCWDDADQAFDFVKLQKAATEFNKTNTTLKKGVAVHPLCFGVSFTKTSLNQGRALVHLYTDGSVSISTGVIEMGQGVNTKLIQVAARTLGISPDRIRVEGTNTTRIANASPTAASSGADLNGGATRLACLRLVERLKHVAAREIPCCDTSRITFKDEKTLVDGNDTGLIWNELLVMAFEARVSLSEHAHYVTPYIDFDKGIEKGNPFAYHVYGNAITGVTVDCIRGTYSVDFVKIIHDFGSSLNLDIDFGQVEGALGQGIGLVTTEELLFNEAGRMVYSDMSSYKVPDIFSAPADLVVKPLKSEPSPMAILGSKAVGEPPLLYGIGTYFAILNAMKSFNPDISLNKVVSPMSHQRCLETLYQGEGDALVDEFGRVKAIL